MSENLGALRRQMDSAGELHSVVRTMKAIAASNIGQYERSVEALTHYYHTVELGLSACFRAEPEPSQSVEATRVSSDVGAIVFGSDQGLVGQFNEVIAEFAVEALKPFRDKVCVWAVGDRVQAYLADAGYSVLGVFPVPNSIRAITPLVAQIQIEVEARRPNGEFESFHVFRNRPTTGALYEPAGQRLLPLDEQWRSELAAIRWPTVNLPEVIGGPSTLRALVREYLFISLFRACAESLASENASRLASMQRAEKNIDQLRETLNADYHRLRQSGIDEELFDVISGFEAGSRV